MCAGEARETIVRDVFFGWDLMRVKTCFFAGAVAVLTVFSSLAVSAYATDEKPIPNPKPAKVKVVHYKEKKNATPYDYLKPKKQKAPTGYYRSSLTGQVVYGASPKH
jgi:hypothetical protein